MGLPALLADTNISTLVVAFLRDAGTDVASAVERGMGSMTDREILATATSEQRWVLTHDADFGRLAILDGAPIHGVIYVRPGDRPPDQVIENLQRLLSHDVEWPVPAVVVLTGGRLRVRRL